MDRLENLTQQEDKSKSLEKLNAAKDSIQEVLDYLLEHFNKADDNEYNYKYLAKVATARDLIQMEITSVELDHCDAKSIATKATERLQAEFKYIEGASLKTVRTGYLMLQVNITKIGSQIPSSRNLVVLKDLAHLAWCAKQCLNEVLDKCNFAMFRTVTRSIEEMLQRHEKHPFICSGGHRVISQNIIQ